MSKHPRDYEYIYYTSKRSIHTKTQNEIQTGFNIIFTNHIKTKKCVIENQTNDIVTESEIQKIIIDFKIIEVSNFVKKIYEEKKTKTIDLSKYTNYIDINSINAFILHLEDNNYTKLTKESKFDKNPYTIQILYLYHLFEMYEPKDKSLEKNILDYLIADNLLFNITETIQIYNISCLDIFNLDIFSEVICKIPYNKILPNINNHEYHIKNICLKEIQDRISKIIKYSLTYIPSSKIKEIMEPE